VSAGRDSRAQRQSAEPERALRRRASSSQAVETVVLRGASSASEHASGSPSAQARCTAAR
jgi:hypothetical protein